MEKEEDRITMKELNNSFSGKIAEYYDTYFLPAQKIQEECNYIMEMISPYLEGYETLVDVGCGTGAHAEKLSGSFKRVHGIDISKDMIDFAEKNHGAGNIIYECMDIRDVTERKEKNSVAISLAHVIGYQLDNDSVEQYFFGINNLLRRGGILFFNFYNQPALYMKSLQPRHTQIQGKDKITRISNATLNPDENCLNLDYYYIFESNGRDVSTYEVHEKMRYFTRLEIEYFLKKSGFELLSFFSYNTKERLSPLEWNGGVIARKLAY